MTKFNAKKCVTSINCDFFLCCLSNLEKKVVENLTP